MKKYVNGFCMSLSMFSKIPLPFHVWDKKYASLVVTSFPLVGLVIGGIWWAVGLLLLWLAVPLMVTAAIMTLMPFFVAGFIHLDGYMDTSDALLSYRPLEDRLLILKDSNIGAFAAVMLGILFVLQFAAMYTVIESGKYLALLVVISVVSRCCAALSMLVLRHIPQSNFSSMLTGDIKAVHKIFIVLLAVATSIAAISYAGLPGLITLCAVILGFMLAIRAVFKSFKGISGDLLGYSLVICELCGLITLAILQSR